MLDKPKSTLKIHKTESGGFYAEVSTPLVIGGVRVLCDPEIPDDVMIVNQTTARKLLSKATEQTNKKESN